MNNIQQILTFVSVVRHASFAGAARELGQSASTTAKSIARLEAQLGIKLFHRTTRQVSLTPDGANLFEHCEHILDEVELIKSVAAGLSGAPSGTLRIDMPVTFGKKVVLPVLAALQKRYPDLSIDALLSDQYTDLIAEGLDATIRIGLLSDSRLVAQPIAEQNLLVCASPGYLKNNRRPGTPDDLQQHHCLLFRIPTTGRSRPWQFQFKGERLEILPKSRFRLGDGEALVQAAIDGLGLVQVPDYMVTDALKAGKLKEVLKSNRPAPMPISIVYPGKRFLPPRVRVLIDALKASNT